MRALKGVMEELPRNRLKQRAPHAQDHCAFSSDHAFCGPCAKRVFKNVSDCQNKRIKWYTFSFRARSSLFCTRFACFLARFAQDPLIISGAKCQHHACQSRPNATRHFSSSKRQPECVPKSSRSNFVMQPLHRPANFARGSFHK